MDNGVCKKPAKTDIRGMDVCGTSIRRPPERLSSDRWATDRRLMDVRWTSSGCPMDVHWTCAGHPIVPLDVGSSSDVRWTSVRHPMDL